MADGFSQADQDEDTSAANGTLEWLSSAAPATPMSDGLPSWVTSSITPELLAELASGGDDDERP